MTQKVFKIDWTEYERGWGQRPDGTSLHLDYVSAIEFKQKIEAGGSEEEFSRGTTPTELLINDDRYQEIVAAGGHMWINFSTHLVTTEAWMG